MMLYEEKEGQPGETIKSMMNDTNPSLDDQG